jgi:acyl carrier protein
MTDSIFEEIKRFIIEVRGNYRKPFTMNTTLERDLKISGDDADEFLEKFSNKFNVKISEGLKLEDYFAAEGSLHLYLLVIFGKPTGLKNITVGHLIKAIEKGILSEDILNK